MNVIRAGTTLHIVAAPKPHLWAVLTDPFGSPSCVVIVMLVTKKPYTDHTVVLGAEDHPFLRHETSVNYSTAEQRKVSSIIAAMKARRCECRESLHRKTLEKLQRGLLDSPHTVHAIRAICEPAFASRRN